MGGGATGGRGGGSAGAAGGRGGGGAAGAGGAGGSPGPIVYDCASPVAPASNLITDFAGGSGGARWTSTSGMSGSSFVYRGNGATASIESTATVHNLHLTATVPASSYAGAGINFDACTTFGSSKSLRFTVAGTTSCSVEIQIQTYRRKPSTDTPPGGCVADATTTCGDYLHLSNIALSPSPVTVTLASFTDWLAVAGTQVVGIQWQLTGNNCTADLHIDDITLVP